MCLNSILLQQGVRCDKKIPLARRARGKKRAWVARPPTTLHSGAMRLIAVFFYLA